MSSLFIIGNGFDLHHGYETSFTSFRDYLKLNEHDVPIGFNRRLYKFFEGMTDSEWESFEESLEDWGFADTVIEDTAYIDNRDSDKEWEHALNNNQDLCDEYVQIIDNEELKNGIGYVLNRFIQDATASKKNADEKLRSIFNENSNSVFINFNYSTTLEDLYGVDKNRILHIHGKIHPSSNLYDRKGLFLGFGETDLIFGHSRGYAKLVLVDDSIFKPHEILDNAFLQLGKNYQIEPMKRFLGTQKFNNLYIIGHSLGDVDWEYFKEISNFLDQNAAVTYFIYEGNENTVYQRLRHLFGKTVNIKFFHY